VIFLWGIALKKARGAALVIDLEMATNKHKFSHGYKSRDNLSYYKDGLAPVSVSEAEAINLEKKRKAKGVILPTNKLKQWWDFLIIVLLLYTAIYIPIKVSFIEDSSTSVFVFELIVDILFLTDVVLTFFTAFYKKHELIIDKTQIMKNYMSGWFLIDFTTSIPTQLIEITFASSDGLSGN
jgi:hypothetical protein